MFFNLIVLYLKWRRPTIERFGVWARLEGLSVDITKAVDEDIAKFPELVSQYLSTALHIYPKIVHHLFWSDAISLYYLAQTINTPNKLPILVASNKKEKPVSWDYPGRNWNYWSHLLASEYGWGLEYIAGMDTNVALAHIQEILTDEQLDHEFIWSTTEIAYPYNSTTKQSRFQPLERPYFMAATASQPKKVRMLKSLMPVGNIENLSGIDNA